MAIVTTYLSKNRSDFFSSISFGSLMCWPDPHPVFVLTAASYVASLGRCTDLHLSWEVNDSPEIGGGHGGRIITHLSDTGRALQQTQFLFCVCDEIHWPRLWCNAIIYHQMGPADRLCVDMFRIWQGRTLNQSITNSLCELNADKQAQKMCGYNE